MDPSEYTDSGMGWFAKSEYMIQNQTAFANMRTLSGAVPAPYAIDDASLFDRGVLVGTYVFSGNGHTMAVYMGTDSRDDDVVITTSNNTIIWACAMTGRRGTWMHYDTTAGTVWLSTQSQALSSGPSAGGLYFYNTDIRTPFYPSPGIPAAPTRDEALAAISVIINDFTKSEIGYSVACVAKWHTQNGTLLISPILISSQTDLANMTYSGTGYNFAKSNSLRAGVRFYMGFWDIPGNNDINTIAPVVDLSDSGNLSLEEVFRWIASGYYASINVYNSPDPYGEEGGGSGEEGGDGDADPEDNPVEEETLPIPAVTGLGFSTIYVPSASDLQSLASYLWGGGLDLDNFLRLFANPMDSILGLSAVPLSLSGTYEPIYLGGQILQGVTMPKYTGRTAVKVDMGSVTISERWGSYLDYDPYTEFAVYLPFIGIKNIKADDIMGKTVSLMYNIDILSGACVAYLRTSGGSVLYEWAGQCAMQIPITGSNWDNIFSTAITAAVTLGGAMVAPASAPMLAGSVASAAVQAVAAKPRVERSGAVTGVTGFLGQLRPYVIRTIPEAYIPNDQNKFIGYPSYISASLGSLTGYNEVASIHLENIPATGDELSELESILKGGVIF